MILNSIDGKRVVHVIGWKETGGKLMRSFDDMRERGQGETERFDLFCYVD